MISSIIDSVTTVSGQKNYIDKQLVKLQWYHKLLKGHTIFSKRTHVRNLLQQYENIIGYNNYCNVRVGDKFKLFKYDDNTIYMTSSMPNDEDTMSITPQQMFKGIWAPVNYDLYPEEVDDSVLNYSSLVVSTIYYNSWAQLEYIRLQLEALMLEQNLHTDQEEGTLPE